MPLGQFVTAIWISYWYAFDIIAINDPSLIKPTSVLSSVFKLTLKLKSNISKDNDHIRSLNGGSVLKITLMNWEHEKNNPLI